jgi:hypothetical protein
MRAGVIGMPDRIESFGSPAQPTPTNTRAKRAGSQLRTATGTIAQRWSTENATWIVPPIGLPAGAPIQSFTDKMNEKRSVGANQRFVAHSIDYAAPAA